MPNLISRRTITEYTAGEDYNPGQIITYQGGLYRVTAVITNAPATPPWTSIENITHQVRATSTTGNITAGDTLLNVGDDGNISVDQDGKISFASRTRQMIDLYGTNFGMGVESSTTFVRTSQNFRVYKGGSMNPGDTGQTGATQLFYVDTNGRVYSGESSTTFPTVTADNQLTTKKYVDDATGGGTDPSPPPSLNWSAAETRDIVANTWYPMFRFDHVNTNGKTGMCIFDMGWNDPAGNQAQSVRYRAQATFSGGTVSVSYQLVNHWRVGAQIATNFRSSWNGSRIQLFYRSTNGAHTGTRVTITVVSLDAGTVTNRLGTGDTVSATDYGGTTLPTAN